MVVRQVAHRAGRPEAILLTLEVDTVGTSTAFRAYLALSDLVRQVVSIAVLAGPVTDKDDGLQFASRLFFLELRVTKARRC